MMHVNYEAYVSLAPSQRYSAQTKWQQEVATMRQREDGAWIYGTDHERGIVRLLANAGTDRECWDAAVNMGAFYVETGHALPPGLREFIAGVLHGHQDPPPKSRLAEGNERRKAECLIAMIEEMDRSVYQDCDKGSKIHIISALSDALREVRFQKLGYETIRNIWQARQK